MSERLSRCVDREHASVLYRALHLELGSVTDVSEALGLNSVSALTNSRRNRCGFSRNPTCTYDVAFSPTCDDHPPYSVYPHLLHMHTRTGGAGASDSTSPGGAESGVNLSALMIFVFPYPLAPSSVGPSEKEGTVVWVRR
jgi:hypothetical protein